MIYEKKDRWFILMVGLQLILGLGLIMSIKQVKEVMYENSKSYIEYKSLSNRQDSIYREYRHERDSLYMKIREAELNYLELKAKYTSSMGKSIVLAESLSKSAIPKEGYSQSFTDSIMNIIFVEK